MDQMPFLSQNQHQSTERNTNTKNFMGNNTEDNLFKRHEREHVAAIMDI